jgi:OOP family OmpA-OmpF porin
MQRMIGKGFVVTAVVMLVLAAAPADAKNGVYVGASVGQTTLNIDDLDVDVDTFDYKADSTTTKFFVGYRFMGFLAVEGSYIDFGSLSDSTDIDGEPVSLETDLKGYDVCAMGMLPLGIADIFIKGGVVSWDADIRAAFDEIIEYDGESGTDLVYGIGAQVRFKGLAVRAEFEYFDIADADSVYLISVGASYTF